MQPIKGCQESAAMGKGEGKNWDRGFRSKMNLKDKILQGAALTVLKTLPDECVDCVVTSPPYWGLRAYGTDPQIWLNGKPDCGDHDWKIEAPRRNRNSEESKYGGKQASNIGSACDLVGGNCAIDG